MSHEIRISTGFLSHPKTWKLRRKLGDAGVVSLVALWLWAGEQRPNGDLAGLDDEEVEFAAKWAGKRGAFAAALVKFRWMDGEPGRYALHGWDEHNGDSQGKAGKNRLHVLARHHPEIYKKLKAKGVEGLSRSEYAAAVSGRAQAGLDAVLDKEPTPKEKREQEAGDRIAAALAPILSPKARNGDDEQTRAANALMVFPHEGRKLAWETAVEWVARMQPRYPGVKLSQAIQDAAMERKTPVKNPRVFMSRWLSRAYGPKKDKA